MKLKEIYDLAVRLGRKNDPRGEMAVKKQLAKAKKAFDDAPEDERDEFDAERLTNPYADTRILYGDSNLEVKNVLAGIDVETPEIVLVDSLRGKGQAIDLVIGHHPEASALAGLPDVMPMQPDIWHMFGVPVNVGDALMDERMKEVMRGILPVNKNRPLDAAKMLDVPFMCCHTPADNMVTSKLTARFDKEGPETVGDVVKILKTFPEYKEAAKEGAGPTVIVGCSANRAGKIFVDMTGGTGGPQKAIEKLVAAGVGTVVGMHMSEKSRKEASKHHLNVVIAGHISSDSIGLNMFLDELEKKGVKVTSFSGLIRLR
ncbi:MAG: NGG1p interacting factor NIF3 [Actinomycetota bacterium]